VKAEDLPRSDLIHLHELPKAAIAVAVLGGSTAIALGEVPGWEEGLFETVNRLPHALEWTLWSPMQLGNLFGPFVVAAGSWHVWRRWRPTVGAVVVGVGSWQLAKVVKNAIERGRPHDVFTVIVRRAGTPKDGLGFVSGHSAVAFSLAAVLSPYLGRWRGVGYGLATTVSFARIHVGAHLPLDTVGGAALGLSLGFAYNAVVGVPAESRGVTPRRLASLVDR
jgi:membrane-associated phospholipid phosphatase